MTRTLHSTITHRTWMALATEEYRRIDELLATLTAADWASPTDCDEWSVRDIVAHLVGSAEATASIREQLRQQRHGRRQQGGRSQLDAVNDLHVRERARLGPAELHERFSDASRRGVRARTRTPAPVRAIRFPFPPPLGTARLGFLIDVVYTRDAWMHRIDICRATGRPIELTADHDALIVADAASAWQRATGSAGAVLTGPAGEPAAGSGGIGASGPGPLADLPVFDAVEFARALSGRTRLPGVSADTVLF